MQPFTTRLSVGRRVLPLVVVLGVGAWWWTRGDGRLFGVFLGLAALFAVLNLGTTVVARLSVDAAGLLTVRDGLFTATRSVDLARLTSAVARLHTSRSGTRDNRRTAVRQVLDLTDEAGREVRLEPRAWQHGDLLLAAVGSTALARGVEVVGASLFGLTSAGTTAEEAGVPSGPGPSSPHGPAMTGGGLLLDLRPNGPVTAGAVIGAVVTGFVGTMFTVVGGGFTFLPGRPTWIALFPVLGVALVVLAVALFVGAVTARLRIDPDGGFAVRSIPPLVTRRVRLDQLAGVDARTDIASSAGARDRRTTRVTLVDRSGARAAFTAESWPWPERLMPALAAWAEHAGATANRPTWDYLRTGRPPG